MNNRIASIDPLTQEHCAVLAEMHLNYLQSNFSGRPGKELLEAYYEGVVLKSGACGFVAQENGKTVGFVCGVWNSGRLRTHLLTSRWHSLAKWGALQVLVQPRIVVSFIRQLSQDDRGLASIEQGYELRPIVVAPAARGSGIANRLVDMLLADAASRGYGRVHLYAEKDNGRARRFYAKVGFVESREVNSSGKRYVLYERSAE